MNRSVPVAAGPAPRCSPAPRWHCPPPPSSPSPKTRSSTARRAMTVMDTHFGRIFAMANGRMPFDAKAVADNAEIATVVSKWQFSGFVDGSDKGETKAEPKIWAEMDKFKAAGREDRRRTWPSSTPPPSPATSTRSRPPSAQSARAARPATTPTARNSATASGAVRTGARRRDAALGAPVRRIDAPRLRIGLDDGPVGGRQSRSVTILGGRPAAPRRGPVDARRRGLGGRRAPADAVPSSIEWPATPMISFRLRSFASPDQRLRPARRPGQRPARRNRHHRRHLHDAGLPDPQRRSSRRPIRRLQGGAGNPQLQGQSPRPRPARTAPRSIRARVARARRTSSARAASSCAAAEAERVPEVRRGRDRPPAADVRRAASSPTPPTPSTRSTTCRSRPTTPSARATRSSCAPGARSTSTTAPRSTATACSTCRRSAASTSPASRPSELERHLRAQIGRLYTNFNLSVALGQLRSVKVFVVGPAQRPGVYTLQSQSTLLSAVVAAGGPASNGSMRKITLRRDGKALSELDVYEFLVQGDKSQRPPARGRRRDRVPSRPAPRVALTGAVDTPAIYELKSAAGAAARPAALCRRRAGAVEPEQGPARAHRSGAADRRRASSRSSRSTPPAR